MMRILITGATGYIGRRLLQRLLDSDLKIRIRLFVTDRRQISGDISGRVEIVEGNTFSTTALKDALKGVETAYYLIHSMGGKGDFEELDRISANNFINECAASGVKRVIYLGGLGEKDSASRHLASRQETGEILSAYPEKLQTIWFRAAIIIGAGGASFEIIRNLVQKLPVMIAPSWVTTLTQPVAVDDVISYLTAALKIRTSNNVIIDIGGEKLSFLQMLNTAARVSGLKRIIIPIPLFSPKLSSYWLIFFTSVPFRLASALVAGLKSESIVKNNNAKNLFPSIKPMSYEESLRKALAEVEKEILSSWSDGSSAWFNSGKKAGEIDTATNHISFSRPVEKSNRKKVWASLASIGGERGWLSMNFLWKLRGHLDKIAGGVGLNRGRRSQVSLRIGDSLDFWRVVDIVPGKRLLLFSQMRLPGKGWLEFRLGDMLSVTAYFIPSGLYGRLYWYILYPFHIVIFRQMIRRISKSETKK